jgi:ribosomal protein S13
VFDIPKKEVDKVSNFIIQRSGGDARASNTMEDTFKEFDECKKFDARHPEVLKHAKNLEGRVRHAGTHAAGVIVSNVKLNRHTPLEVRGGQNGNITTALDWRETDKQGFLKMDLLGLKTLSIIKDTIDQVKLTKEDFDKYNIDLDFPKDEEEITMKRKHLVHVDYNDERVLDEFRAGDTEGVFQFNSVGMSDILKDMKVKGFKDLVALNALYRPGGMRSGIARDYIERRNGEQEIEKVNPIYDKITEETQGLIVFQEQVMKIFSDMANRNAIEVNKMREKVAKSHGMQSMQEEKKGFIEGCVENDIDKEFAEELFQKIAHFGSYAFNKCVSGKTILNIERKEGLDRQVNIENLYDRYEGKNIPKGEIKVRSYKSDDGFRSIKRVYKTGIKEVYRLGLTLGNFIYATKDHKFLTDLGWKRLGNLSMNDFIYVWDNNCNRNKYKLSGIESIKEVGEEMTYDLEVYSNNEIGHNYIANGIVTHNSHAIVYTQIAYWTQWLKTFYPLEFYVASLNNESDDDKVRRLLGALEKKGYRLLLPHVNKSKEGFRVEEWDGEKAIRFGLRYIKGIGETTAEEIVKHQPYEDEEDIKTRKGIKRRTFHKGIRRLLREVDAWVDDDSYSQEELEGLREFLAAEELLPLPVLGKNIKKAREMAKNYDVNLTDVKDIDFSHNDFVYLCGVFNGANYARIGDFGKPSKYSKWEVGDRYVMMDLQDGTAHMRIKFNPKKYQEYKDKLRIGQKVLIHGRIIKDIKMVFIDFMVVLSEEKIKEHKEKYGEE